MSIRRTEAQGYVVVHVTGDVEAMTATRFADAVTATLGEGRPVVVDLTDVTFLDSAGLTVLVQVTERSEDGGTPLRLAVDHNRPVVRPIQITGLEHRLALYEGVPRWRCSAGRCRRTAPGHRRRRR